MVRVPARLERVPQHDRERGRGGEDPRLDADRGPRGSIRSLRRRPGSPASLRCPTIRRRPRDDGGRGRGPRNGEPPALQHPDRAAVGTTGASWRIPARQDEVPRAPRGAAPAPGAGGGLPRGGFAVCRGFREQIFHFMVEPMRKAGFTGQFIFTGPAEALMLYMKMAFFVGIFLAAPFMLWEIWGFISPGLYKNEKKWAFPFIGMGTVFFTGGALRALLPVPDDLPVPLRVRRPGHAVPAADRRVLVVLLVVPAGAGARLPDPGRHLRPRPARPRTPGSLIRGWKFAILGLVRPVGDHHADSRRGDPDRPRRADDRPLRARGARRLAVREEARTKDESIRAGRSGPSTPARPSRGGPGPR